MFRQNFRGAEEWISEGLSITTTTSEEAIKLFDAGLTQLVGWYDDPQQNGLASTLERMIQADPNFVLGRTFALGTDLIGTGTTTRLDYKLKDELEQLKQLAFSAGSKISWREQAHLKAMDRFANGNMKQAAQIWEQILLEHPTDMMAVKFAHDTYFYLGEKQQIRDSIARVLPYWENKNPPLQCYMYGMHAFGLEETQFYSEAEKQAKLGLQKMPNDPWAVHALAHVFEMQMRTVEGLGFLSGSVKQWDMCNYLACHNFWHWALYHIEQNEPDAAAELYEREISSRASKSGAMLDIVDASSLLYRLDLLHPQKYTTAANWAQVLELCEPHLQDHILGFNDAHFTMACLGSECTGKAEEVLQGLCSVESAGVISDHWISVTKQVLEAMIDFKREKYQDSADKLLNVRYDIVKMGGSDAQRDVFNQLLIMAAVRAKNQKLCQSLLNERKALKGKDLIVRLSSFQ